MYKLFEWSGFGHHNACRSACRDVNRVALQKGLDIGDQGPSSSSSSFVLVRFSLQFCLQVIFWCILFPEQLVQREGVMVLWTVLATILPSWGDHFPLVRLKRKFLALRNENDLVDFEIPKQSSIVKMFYK